jgi:hypothetical protein
VVVIWPDSRKAEAIDSVERCGLVTLGQCWIVEDSVHEVIYLAAKSQDGLADMHELGGFGAGISV